MQKGLKVTTVGCLQLARHPTYLPHLLFPSEALLRRDPKLKDYPVS